MFLELYASDVFAINKSIETVGINIIIRLWRTRRLRYLVLLREILQRKNILLLSTGESALLINISWILQIRSRRWERSKSKVCAAENFTLLDA